MTTTAPVWLVTGAGTGLGRATALAAARRGAHVVLSGRSRRRLTDTANAIADLTAEASGGIDVPEPAVLPMDLAGAGMDDYSHVADMLDTQYGRLDAIVHAAVAFTGLTPLHELPPQDMAIIMHVNVTAPWLLTRALLPLLSRQPSAVCWIDDAHARNAEAFWGAYGMSKTALARMQQTWAAELDATTPVRMIRFAPPAMRTALRRLAFPAEDMTALARPSQVAETLCDTVDGALSGLVTPESD